MSKATCGIVRGAVVPDCAALNPGYLPRLLTDGEMINTNPQVGAGRRSAYNLYKRAR